MTDTRDVAYIRKRLCDASDLMSEVFVRVEDMSKENTKLKELLKEYKRQIDKLNNPCQNCAYTDEYCASGDCKRS